MRSFRFFSGIFLCLGLVLWSVSPGWALGLEVAAGIWSQDPNGFISYKGDNLTSEDLGFSQKSKVYGRAKIDLPLINLYLMVTPVKFEGSGTLNRTFTFGGRTFSANIPFSSRLDLNQYDVGLYWGLPFLKAATKTATLGQIGFGMDLGLDVKIVDLEARITQSTLTEQKSITIPIPMLYVSAGLELWRLAFEAEGRGISYDGSYFYDLLGRVKIKALRFPLGGSVFVEGGYRYQKIKLSDIGDVTGSLEIGGPFVGIGGAF